MCKCGTQLTPQPGELRLYRMGNFFGAAGGFGGAYDVDLGDIFNSFFGGGFGGSTRSRRTGPMKGANLKYGMTLEFMEGVTTIGTGW